MTKPHSSQTDEHLGRASALAFVKFAGASSAARAEDKFDHHTGTASPSNQCPRASQTLFSLWRESTGFTAASVPAALRGHC